MSEGLVRATAGVRGDDFIRCLCLVYFMGVHASEVVLGMYEGIRGAIVLILMIVCDPSMSER